MKYTIELTDKQKKVMDCLVEIIHRYIGFNPKFEMYREPVVITKTVTDPNADAIYEQCYEDGKNEAIHNGELIPELKKQEYDRGFNDGRNFGYKIGFSKGMNQSATRIDLSADAYGIGVSYKEALDDVSDLMAFFNCEFMSECYPEEYKEDYSLYDLNAKYGLAEVVEKWKAYTKQKKEIENYNKVVDTLRTVTDEYPRETIVSALSEFGIEVKE